MEAPRVTRSFGEVENFALKIRLIGKFQRSGGLSEVRS